LERRWRVQVSAEEIVDISLVWFDLVWFDGMGDPRFVVFEILQTGGRQAVDEWGKVFS